MNYLNLNQNLKYSNLGLINNKLILFVNIMNLKINCNLYYNIQNYYFVTF